MSYTRTCILAMSDTHGGFQFGLCSPETNLNGEKPKLNNSQQYLWEDVYIPMLYEAFSFIDGDNTVLFHFGDVTQGNKYPSEQTSTKIADQFLIAAENFEPALQHSNVKAVRIAEGTAAHSFGEGSSELLVSELIQARHPDLDVRSVQHGLSNISGALIDYAHHGASAGGRVWLSGNECRYYLRSLLLGEILGGRKPPDLYFRGHYHTFIKEFLSIPSVNGDIESWLVMCPSLCLLGDFGTQKTRSVPTVTNGVVVIELVNEKVSRIKRFTKTLDVRSYEEISL